MNDLETRLREIEEREKAATPGPWDTGEHPTNSGIRYVFDTDGSEVCTVYFNEESRAVEFIAHAREDVPFLIAEVRRLQNELCLVTTVMQCSRCDNSQRPRYMVDGMCGECAAKELERLREENKELGVRLLDSRNLVYERCVEIDKLRDWQKRAAKWLEPYSQSEPHQLLTEAEAGE